MNRKRVLVTGGAGFIGSHLVERLIKLGHEVTVLDNLSTGRLNNLNSVKDRRRFKFIKIDIASEDSKLEKYFKNIDWVFHLAALADIVPSIVAPGDYHRSNVCGTFNILEAARIYKVKKFIYTASSSCYGIATKFPTNEKATIKPQYPYALTKYVGESISLHYGIKYDLNVISLRLFNVYGPRSRTSGTYGAVFGVFLAQLLNGLPYTVVGDGRQRRDFTFVADVVEAYISAAKSIHYQEIFNVGSSKPQSVNRLVDLLDKKAKELGISLGFKKSIIYIPKRPGEPDCTWADTTKIKKMLGWQTKVSFEDGVGKIVEQIDYWKEAPVWTKDKIAQATKDWFKYLN